MIVSCPECHTLYRHRTGGRRRARCGACHAEVVLPAARTYVVQAVGVPAFAAAAAVAEGADRASPPAPWPGPPLGESRSRPPRAAVPAKPSADFPVPEAMPFPAEEETNIDRRLDAIVRAAGGDEAAEGTTLRAVLFGVGLGTIAGVAFAPGLFHAPWLGWAAGGVVGGTLGAMWSRLWGSRNP